MGQTRSPKPVKLFAGLLSGDPDLLLRARQLLTRSFGPVDLEAGPWPFTQTDYYEPEMGCDLQRRFVSFVTLIPPGQLADIKHETNLIEEQIADQCLLADVSRPVNIDPGYVDLSKLVLGTTKDGSHRIYIGHGMYAEVTLQYADGGWKTLPWTYPDYREEAYHAFFVQLRQRLREDRQAALDRPTDTR